jgi:hypothetical protein
MGFFQVTEKQWLEKEKLRVLSCELRADVFSHYASQNRSLLAANNSQLAA